MANLLKIVETIAVHDYTTFGMCLLQDENGEEVNPIKKDHNSIGAKSVTRVHSPEMANKCMHLLVHINI